MEWFTDPWTIGVVILTAAVAFAASVFRHWSARATVEYVIGAVLMILAIRWATHLGTEAVTLAAVAGIGTGLATRAVDRADAQRLAKGAH